jgi:ubiquinone/menaquinone biosynthesis C-methylase UbiE
LAVLRTKDAVATYAALAKAQDLHHLSGRLTHRELTRYINEQIEAGLELDPDCSVIDIGCGDGTLLAGLQGKVRESLGIVPSAEELVRLDAAYDLPNLRFARGLADAVPAPDNSFDRVVINGVLLVLDEAAVPRAVAELKRVARPGALIWIGEVPDRDELAVKNRYRGRSTVGFLLHKWRQKGFRKALRKAISLLKPADRAEVVFGHRMFWMPSDSFLTLCRAAGLELVWARRHREIDSAGQPRESPTRMDYLFRA